MADITMCVQTACPNAPQCHRAQATPDTWQSKAAFEYTVGAKGVSCEFYVPCMAKVGWMSGSQHQWKELSNENEACT